MFGIAERTVCEVNESRSTRLAIILELASASRTEGIAGLTSSAIQEVISSV